MDTITVNRTKQTTVEFDLRVEGASTEDARSRLIIHCEGFNLMFDCKRDSQSTFITTIPPVSFLDRGTHDCSVEVIINGQLFTPLKGTVIAVDDVSVSVSPKSNSKDENNEEGEEYEEEKASPKSILNYMQNHDAVEEEETVTEHITPIIKTPRKIEKKKKSVVNEKEVKVRQILESMDHPVKKKTRSISLKTLTSTKN
jgi:hypothetical protein